MYLLSYHPIYSAKAKRQQQLDVQSLSVISLFCSIMVSSHSFPFKMRKIYKSSTLSLNEVEVARHSPTGKKVA
ncbi:hypothetical protein [Lysinibacillus sp. fls2-241-R2A-57]|uniref:hypothetical protein n=1 Tax=Lysinibacillus sp. fls2-241-R2A-57 TaxID=3040292 RepID=UPI002555FA0B|nr:hypothetical protein [Lysinibacillus sp. fls2-241-R2A-57]